eukprot:TRINITY_DN10740_c0_g1_i29.p1 TRINITY_DN10740_c0_g1~~TRINITY_DN10740_c0_g1_i29.p1  ORF type:complete len:224 (+),score=42.69 TRINITY_DN10740_c0_g1_i29:653-1324(+)
MEQIEFTLKISTGSAFHSAKGKILVNLIPRPHRRYRVLWDEFHLLGEERENRELLYHKYAKLYSHVTKMGYYMEVLRQPWNCFNPRRYGTLIISAPKRPFGKSEIEKLRGDIENTQLSLVVFGEWQEDLRSARLLNQLLSPYFIELGDRVYSGEFSFDTSPYLVGITSSSSIVRFPKNALLLSASLLNEVTALTNSSSAFEDVAVFGFIPRVWFWFTLAYWTA